MSAMKPISASKSSGGRDPTQAGILARKRARDRRAQQAMRNRAKAEIVELREQVTQLEERLKTRETIFTRDLLRYIHENDQLRQELSDLRHQTTLTRSQNLDSRPDARWTSQPTDLSIDSSVLAAWCSPNPNLLLSPADRTLPAIHTITDSFAPPDYLRTPLQIPPTCPADRIMQPFVQKMRLMISGQATDMNDAAASPSPATLSPSEVQLSISKVIADILSTYPAFNVLTKKVACLVAVTSFINWLVFRTKESFEQMPLWMRPTKTQLEVPHPAWMDRVTWPYVRDCLIREQNVTFQQYSDTFSPSFSLNWPYGDDQVVLEEADPETNTKVYRISPAFVEHARDLNSWTLPTLDTLVWQTYPQLGEALVRSCKEFGGPSNISNIMRWRP